MQLSSRTPGPGVVLLTPKHFPAQGQVSVLCESYFHGKQILRIPKGQTVSPTAEWSLWLPVFESVKDEDNIDIWGCDVMELQSFKGKNHLSPLHAIFSVLFTCLIGLKYLAPFKILIVNLYCKI